MAWAITFTDAGLGQAGHALDQDVAARQEGDHQAFEEPTLADDLALEAIDQAGEDRAGRVGGEFGHGGRARRGRGGHAPNLASGGGRRPDDRRPVRRTSRPACGS